MKVAKFTVEMVDVHCEDLQAMKRFCVSFEKNGLRYMEARQIPLIEDRIIDMFSQRLRIDYDKLISWDKEVGPNRGIVRAELLIIPSKDYEPQNYS